MLTVGAYVRYVQLPNSWRRYLPVAVFFALGLLCKPMAVTLPFVLLLLDYWPLQRFRPGTPARVASPPVQAPVGWGIARRLILEKIPLIALAAAACVGTILAAGKAVTSAARISMPVRLDNVFISYVVYLRQMVWPTGLAAFYPFPQKSPPFWEIALAFLLLAVICAGVLAFWRKRPWLSVGWFWYLGMLVPVIGIVSAGDFCHADRNTCLPQIGLYVMLTWAVADWCAHWNQRRRVLGGLMIAVVGALMFCAQAQTSYWKNGKALWTRELACTDGNYLAHNNLGVCLDKEGRQDEAIAEYRKALEIKPDYSEALNDLGVVYYEKGDLEAAIAQYRKALETQPDSANIRYNLGNALASHGKLEEAIAQYRTALKAAPNDGKVVNNLGISLGKNGQLDEAITLYRQFLKVAPDNAKALNNLGVALLTKGDLDGAMAQYRKALEVAPDNAEALRNLGSALQAKGDWEAAIEQYHKALKIAPDNAEAIYNLGSAMERKGENEGAIEQYRKALEIKPDYVEARNSLGAALYAKGDREAAIEQYRKALETQPDYAEARNNLGVALYAKGDLEAAIMHYRKALELKPNYAEAIHNLGSALATKGEYEAAIEQYRKALEIKPDYVEARYNLGNALFMKGDLAEAIAEFQKANQVSGGDNPMILRTLAAAYAETGSYGQATDTARRALELATKQKKDALAATLQKELKLYETGAPVRDPARSEGH
jgi:Flp pilus assembly protein TadD